jgi:glycine betaine/choline ABC-type transport system substrate-binding protein
VKRTLFFLYAAMAVACALLLQGRHARSQTPDSAGATVTVGSKGFPESWILGASLTALAEEAGAINVTHRKNLGGTEITYQALKSGSIDVYPEYTGTITEVILKSTAARSYDDMRAALAESGLGMSDPLGFNDGYALAVSRDTAARLGLRNISDLKAHPELRLGFTHEFLGRADGFPGLAQRYGLTTRAACSTSSRTRRWRAGSSMWWTFIRPTLRSRSLNWSCCTTISPSFHGTTRCSSIAAISNTGRRRRSARCCGWWVGSTNQR